MGCTSSNGEDPNFNKILCIKKRKRCIKNIPFSNSNNIENNINRKEDDLLINIEKINEEKENNNKQNKKNDFIRIEKLDKQNKDNDIIEKENIYRQNKNDEINKNIEKKNIKKNEKNNTIKLVIHINKKDRYKEIYFLDNLDNIKERGEKERIHRHDNLKEMNAVNTILYINDVKYKYRKSFKFKDEGDFLIKLKLSILIEDCSYMFYDCKNIQNSCLQDVIIYLRLIYLILIQRI